MSSQRIGMCFLDRPDPRHQIALAVRMEECGYESVWVCETRTARDAISVMGAMAFATKEIKIGSGVVNSWTRSAKGDPSFQPLARGLVAALPHVNALVAAMMPSSPSRRLGRGRGRTRPSIQRRQPA